MRLFQRIEELDYSFYDLNVDDRYVDDADICVENNDFQKNNEVSIRCKTMHTNGLHIFESSLKTLKKLAVSWITEGPHIRYFFHLGGCSRVENGAGRESYQHRVGMLQRNFLDTVGGGGTVHIEANNEVSYVILKMSVDFYTHLLAAERWIKNDSFHKYVLTGIPENRPNETLYIDFRILQILEDIRTCDQLNNQRYHFLKLKLRELMFMIYQQTNYGAGTHQASLPGNNLEMIRAYLMHHLDNPPSSIFLARKFFMNEKKLKQDFKNTYGKTIYAFIVQLRMEKARKLLFENYNVNELALLLGYQSVSHFIKVFKAHFGDTPKELLKKYQAIHDFKHRYFDT